MDRVLSRMSLPILFLLLILIRAILGDGEDYDMVDKFSYAMEDDRQDYMEVMDSLVSSDVSTSTIIKKGENGRYYMDRVVKNLSAEAPAAGGGRRWTARKRRWRRDKRMTEDEELDFLFGLKNIEREEMSEKEEEAVKGSEERVERGVQLDPDFGVREIMNNRQGRKLEEEDVVESHEINRRQSPAGQTDADVLQKLWKQLNADDFQHIQKFSDDTNRLRWEEPTISSEGCVVQKLMAQRFAFNPSCNPDGTYTGKQCFLERCWCADSKGRPVDPMFETRFKFKKDAVYLSCSDLGLTPQQNSAPPQPTAKKSSLPEIFQKSGNLQASASNVGTGNSVGEEKESIMMKDALNKKAGDIKNEANSMLSNKNAAEKKTELNVVSSEKIKTMGVMDKNVKAKIDASEKGKVAKTEVSNMADKTDKMAADKADKIADVKAGKKAEIKEAGKMTEIKADKVEFIADEMTEVKADKIAETGKVLEVKEAAKMAEVKPSKLAEAGKMAEIKAGKVAEAKEADKMAKVKAGKVEFIADEMVEVNAGKKEEAKAGKMDESVASVLGKTKELKGSHAEDSSKNAADAFKKASGVKLSVSGQKDLIKTFDKSDKDADIIKAKEKEFILDESEKSKRFDQVRDLNAGQLETLKKAEDIKETHDADKTLAKQASSDEQSKLKADASKLDKLVSDIVEEKDKLNKVNSIDQEDLGMAGYEKENVGIDVESMAVAMNLEDIVKQASILNNDILGQEKDVGKVEESKDRENTEVESSQIINTADKRDNSKSLPNQQVNNIQKLDINTIDKIDRAMNFKVADADEALTDIKAEDLRGNIKAEAVEEIKGNKNEKEILEKKASGVEMEKAERLDQFGELDNINTVARRAAEENKDNEEKSSNQDIEAENENENIEAKSSNQDIETEKENQNIEAKSSNQYIEAESSKQETLSDQDERKSVDEIIEDIIKVVDVNLDGRIEEMEEERTEEEADEDLEDEIFKVAAFNVDQLELASELEEDAEKEAAREDRDRNVEDVKDEARNVGDRNVALEEDVEKEKARGDRDRNVEDVKEEAKNVENRNVEDRNVEDRNVALEKTAEKEEAREDRDRNVEDVKDEARNVEDRNVELEKDEARNVEDRNVEDRNVEDRNVEDRNVEDIKDEDRNVVDKKDEAKNVEDRNFEDRNAEDRNVEDIKDEARNVEDKKFEDRNFEDRNVEQEIEEAINVEDVKDEAIKVEDVKGEAGNVEDRNAEDRKVEDRKDDAENVEARIVETKVDKASNQSE